MVALARPVLVELASALGEAAGLSVPDGFAVHYVDQVDTAQQVQIRDWTGTRAPMHVVSSGLVLLASMPPSTLDAFLRRPLERFTPSTMTEGAAVRARLADVRRDGYAWVHEEFAEGLNSVAAPIEDRAGVVVAALHVHGPSYRFPGAKDEAEIAATVVDSAHAISARLRASRSD
jgi:DNA-binding IclR family transcriptional regulator